MSLKAFNKIKIHLTLFILWIFLPLCLRICISLSLSCRSHQYSLRRCEYTLVLLFCCLVKINENAGRNSFISLLLPGCCFLVFFFYPVYIHFVHSFSAVHLSVGWSFSIGFRHFVESLLFSSVLAQVLCKNEPSKHGPRERDEEKNATKRRKLCTRWMWQMVSLPFHNRIGNKTHSSE